MQSWEEHPLLCQNSCAANWALAQPLDTIAAKNVPAAQGHHNAAIHTQCILDFQKLNHANFTTNDGAAVPLCQ